MLIYSLFKYCIFNCDFQVLLDPSKSMIKEPRQFGITHIIFLIGEEMTEVHWAFLGVWCLA